jgi:DNA-binding transcriptional LysR family regulator
VSRQIQALEEEVGTALFLRHTRAVDLTSAGSQLLSAAASALERIDASVRQIRQTAGRKSVAITTWASFASMWLIPRLEAFQRDHPDIDIRIDATDNAVDMTTADVDLALRYAVPQGIPASAQRLFGEQLTPVVSPWLLKSQPINSVEDLARCALIEAGDAHRTRHLEWLTWQRWLDTFGAQPLAGSDRRSRASAKPLKISPQRWMYFNYAHQIVQAALTGQGVALARLPLVAESLASGALVEPLPHTRLDSPLVYWLMVAPRSAQRPEVKAFCDWLLVQAAATREAIGDVPDPDTVDNID